RAFLSCSVHSSPLLSSTAGNSPLLRHPIGSRGAAKGRAFLSCTGRRLLLCGTVSRSALLSGAAGCCRFLCCTARCRGLALLFLTLLLQALLIQALSLSALLLSGTLGSLLLRRPLLV